MTDDVMKSRLDQLVEAEVVQGFRIVEVPDTIQKAIDDARQIDPALPRLKKLRLSKLTPKKRALVSEAVLNRYHEDLKDERILSRKTIRELNVKRGEWSIEQEKRIEELQASTRAAMQELSSDGLNKELRWRQDMEEAAQSYLKALASSDKHADEKKFLEDIFNRWSSYTPEQKTLYQVYAESQGKAEYSPDVDLSRLYDTAPTTDAAEALSRLDELQYKLTKYVQLYRERIELMGLLSDQARMYAESVENRRENAEEMARMYYGTTVLADDGSPVGTITPALEGFWDLPEEFIAWLLEEAYFFYNSVPKAMREHLDEWGFTTAGRENGLLAALGESLVPQSSSTDTAPSTETPSDSLVETTSKS